MRRLSSGVAVVLVLLIGLVVSSGTVIAQEATPVAGPHPLVGTWLLDIDSADPENTLEVAVFTADGGFGAADVDGLVTFGAWELTGDRTANLTIWVPLPAEEGGGLLIIRGAIDTADDGQSWTGEYTYEFIGPDGATIGDGEYGPASASATRLTVEPMGSPVGSMEDLFSMLGGEEEGTPEP